MRWAEECQNVFFPSWSVHVSNFSVASELIGRVASQTSPFTSAASTFLANPSDMDFAMSNAVTPASYCLIAPSGNVILIIQFSSFCSKEGKVNKTCRGLATSRCNYPDSYRDLFPSTSDTGPAPVSLTIDPPS